MVYINNIMIQHENLSDGFKIQLIFRSGKISTILKTDTLEKLNGDLKLTRYYNEEFLCAVVLDCAEVESFNIVKDERF